MDGTRFCAFGLEIGGYSLRDLLGVGVMKGGSFLPPFKYIKFKVYFFFFLIFSPMIVLKGKMVTHEQL